ncbi:MAG: glycoside hydrolase family 5 protein, partial [Porcipelethomonas sp.]
MNLKKKIAALLTSAACAASWVSFSGTDLDSVFAVGLSGKTAFEITSEMTVGWNLGNTLDCNNTGATYSTPPKLSVTKWGQPEPTQELFDAVKAGGFNTVRIPTTWYEHIQQNSSGDWEISPEWMAYVKKTVDYAYKNDMFVILNIHHEDFINVSQFTDATKAAASEKLADIWSQIAEEFKDYDQHLIFEGMNEPRQTYDPSVEWGGGDTESWQYVNDLNKVFIDTVRGQGSSENSERVLMLPGYGANCGINTVRSIDVPEGSGNVALSVHAYLPYFFAMDTSTMSNHTYPGQSGYGGDYTAEIKEFFSNMKSVINEKNVPIIIGEFSASDFSNTDSRVAWATDYLTEAESAGIPCVVWDNNVVDTEGSTPSGEKHGYINRKTNTWYENSAPVVEAMMKAVGVTNYSLPVYSAQDFSWSNISIGSDWVELFRSENGETPTDENGNPGEWANIDIPGFQNYINSNYKIVLIADSAADPAMVLMTSKIGVVDGMGWNYIMQDGTSTQDYVYNFNYEDMVATVEATGDSMSNVTNLFASAHGAIVKVYGVYAVPVDSQEPSTEPTTEPATEPITTEPATEPTTEETTSATTVSD